MKKKRPQFGNQIISVGGHFIMHVKLLVNPLNICFLNQVLGSKMINAFYIHISYYLHLLLYILSTTVDYI